jgi:hypothetical protein
MRKQSAKAGGRFFNSGKQSVIRLLTPLGMRYDDSYIQVYPSINSKHLMTELRQLERRARSAGRDLVDHPPRGTDDLANAVAGVCSRLGARSQHICVVE